MKAEELDEILDLMRSYFDVERALQEQVPNCESESEHFARQRHEVLLKARAVLQAKVEALLENR